MAIDRIQLGSPRLTPTPQHPTTGPAAAAESFNQMVKTALDNIKETRQLANRSVTDLAAGQPVELHDVMLNTEQASLAFQLALQIRNKLIEAYQEILRMQV